MDHDYIISFMIILLLLALTRTKRLRRSPCGGRSTYALFAQVHFGAAENFARAI